MVVVVYMLGKFDHLSSACNHFSKFDSVPEKNIFSYFFPVFPHILVMF